MQGVVHLSSPLPVYYTPCVFQWAKVRAVLSGPHLCYDFQQSEHAVAILPVMSIVLFLEMSLGTDVSLCCAYQAPCAHSVL